MKFTVKLADVSIGINSIYDEVFKLCRDYLSQDAASFWVEVSERDIEYERERSRHEAEYEGISYTDFDDAYLETLAVYRKIAEGLLRFDVFLMHGAAVGAGGKAYLFTAPSGVGKTTHTRLWCEEFPDAFIINGDKPLIKLTENGAYIYGTPWAGKEGQNCNISLPLGAVCTLFRAGENSIKPACFSDIFPLLIGQSYRPRNEADLEKTLGLIKRLGESVRLYALFCNVEPEAAHIAREGMCGNEQ